MRIRKMSTKGHPHQISHKDLGINGFNESANKDQIQRLGTAGRHQSGLDLVWFRLESGSVLSQVRSGSNGTG